MSEKMPIRRRELLVAGTAMAGFLRARTIGAQTSSNPPTRAAVVIGVNKTGGLPILNAAASGAREFSLWLEKEGFRVKLLTDDQSPILASDIFGAVSEYINSRIYDQLVIYFSGHGFWNSYSECWMLSGAPDNPNEAISLIESVDLARESGIPNVVFISDACRSTANSIGADRVRGSLVFPNSARVSQPSSEIDRFFAALPGNPALEVPVATSTANFEGLYTAALLNAFTDPDPSLVRVVDQTAVLPNRALKRYLSKAVPQRAAARSLKLNQMPDAYLECGEDTYIGRARMRGVPEGSGYPDEVSIVPTLGDVAGRALRSLDAPTGRPPSLAKPEDIERLAVESGFEKTRSTIIDADKKADDIGAASAASGAGYVRINFTITGTNVVAAETNLNNSRVIINGNSETYILQIEPPLSRPATIAVRFGDGSGTVLACLPEYDGSITVADGRVTNVSYSPSRENWRWSDYQEQRQRLDLLRATVASAAQFGVFRIEGDSETRGAAAREFADRIRVLKSIDPTLGIYAAYAYTQAGLAEQVESVAGFMREDLEGEIFDVAMLAGLVSSDANDHARYVPFCPMLSQGWSFLRVRNVRLLRTMEMARDHLLPALWTTFDPEGMSIVFEGLRT